MRCFKFDFWLNQGLNKTLKHFWFQCHLNIGCGGFFLLDPLDSLNHGCTTQISWRAKIFLRTYPRAKIICFNPLTGSVCQENMLKSITFWDLRAKWLASAGQMWPAGRMLCMPALNCHVSLCYLLPKNYQYSFLISWPQKILGNLGLHPRT